MTVRSPSVTLYVVSFLSVGMLVPLACSDDSAPGQATTTSATDGSGAGDMNSNGPGIETGPSGPGSGGAGGTTSNGPGPGSGGMVNEGGMGTPSYVLDETYGGSGKIVAKDVAIDGNGNIIVVGTFDGSVDFGGGTDTGSGDDAFVASYDASGNYNWHVSAGDGQQQVANCVAIDSDNHIIVGGHVDGSMNWGKTNLNSLTQFADAYLVKLCSTADGALGCNTGDGEEAWAEIFQLGDGKFHSAVGCGVDSNDNAYVTGFFQDQITLGGGTLTALGGQGDWDIFLGKFSAAGVHLDSASYGGTEEQYPEDLDVGADGSIAIVGYTLGDIDFGTNITNAAGSRSFIARLTTGFEHEFSKVLGGDDTNRATAVVIADNGDTFVGGNFKNTIDFGAKSFTSTTASDEPYVVRYDDGGGFEYGVGFTGKGIDRVNSIDVDSAGYAVIVGRMNDELKVHSQETLQSAGLADAYAIRLGPPGNAFWGLSRGSTSNDFGYGVAVDSADNIVIVGEFKGTVDFGGGDATATNQDLFIVKFAPGD